MFHSKIASLAGIMTVGGALENTLDTVLPEKEVVNLKKAEKAITKKLAI